LIHPAGVEREIRRLSIAKRWRLLSIMARRYPTSVTDALSRMQKKKDITVVAWTIHGSSQDSE
jgi:hypothetical protein